MMEASTDLFINVIQNHRIVYDKSSKDFKNTRKKEEAWLNIAGQCRMTVDATKKRYFSLRQKYCREKRSIEVKRRYKLPTHKNWVFYDRLSFLDSFIQPRSTFTNDKFEEKDYDEQVQGNEASVDVVPTDETPMIDIELQEGIDITEIEDSYQVYENDEVQQHPNPPTGTIQNCQQNCNEKQQVDGNSQNDTEWNLAERIISQYTGEESLNYCVPSSALEHTQSDEIISTCTTSATIEGYQQSQEPFDMDNYTSRYPGTSASQTMIPPQSRNNAVKDVLVCGSLTTGGVVNRPEQLPPNHSKSSAVPKTIPRGTARQNQVKLPPPPNRKTQPTTSSLPQSTSSALVFSESREKRIEAIRQKMESCLTAITNKVTDKGQRSPHAPFLAYLGTKLPKVPVEILPNLEREILDLVEHHSK